MRRLITIVCLLGLLVAPSAGQWLTVLSGKPPSTAVLTVDFWEDFEFATLNTASLAANDHNAGGTWSLTDASTLLSTHASGQKATISTINGSATTGSYGLKRDGSASTAAAYAQYQFAIAPDTTAVSYGFWYYIPSSGGDYSAEIAYFYNVVGVRARNIAGVYSIRWDDSTGIITVPAADAWYWVTAKVTRNATCYLRVYDSTGVQVGSETTFAGRNNSQAYLMIGNINAATATTGIAYWDNVVVDYTTATFPLGP